MPTIPEPPTSSAILDHVQIEQFIRDGFVIAQGLLPADLVESTREDLLQIAEIDPRDPQSWESKQILNDPRALALTEPCRTPGVEAIARELVGPHFVKGEAFSTNLALSGVEPPTLRGFIPVLRFPESVPNGGAAGFYPLVEQRHIDGNHFVTTWPTICFLVVFAYLSDVSDHGGATAVWPGSHRQIFEHWIETGSAGSPQVPDVEYSPPTAVPGNAGDVIFMHYLLAHSGSHNFSDQIRIGFNTAIFPDASHPYEPKSGAPNAGWTPLDWTLRTDIITNKSL